MAIAQMAKVMVVCHRSQASELLEVLQGEGICHILNAEEAVVSRDMPELAPGVDRPRDIETLINRLQKRIAFLKDHAEAAKGLASVLAPRTVVDEQSYDRVISDKDVLKSVDRCEQIEATIDRTKTEIESLHGRLDMLGPWASLESPVEELGRLHRSTCWAGMIPNQQFEQAQAKIAELGAAIQHIGTSADKEACLVVALKEDAEEALKLLRSVEFEQASFESMSGTVAELIAEQQRRLEQASKQLQGLVDEAVALAKNLLSVEILHDHYSNLLDREQTRDTAPATEHTVILEGWVKKGDYPRLERAVSRFGAVSLSKVEPAEDEEVPVEIENKNAVKPFEVITRLYGMPKYFEVDPTAFLAPFFAIFFGLCLTDAGYGLVIIAMMVFLIKKMQGDKKLMWMLGICAAATVVAGALTGGWFGDGIQKFIPALAPVREKMMWFDPLEKPMTFFVMALVLGYVQIMAGLAIGFFHYLKRKDYIVAVCDYLTWLVMLNALVLFLAGKFGVLAPGIGSAFGLVALVPAVTILLFSHREGRWAGRIGMGLYNLFSTIFYMGDVLSYLRLMALGMVTAGLAMAINVITEIVGKIPYGIGVLAMIIVFVGGHLFNLAINALGAFVHTLRLQYVEFFPKFLLGGGRQFEPLSKKYKHVYIAKQESSGIS